MATRSISRAYKTVGCPFLSGQGRGEKCWKSGENHARVSRCDEDPALTEREAQRKRRIAGYFYERTPPVVLERPPGKDTCAPATKGASVQRGGKEACVKLIQEPTKGRWQAGLFWGWSFES